MVTGVDSGYRKVTKMPLGGTVANLEAVNTGSPWPVRGDKIERAPRTG